MGRILTQKDTSVWLQFQLGKEMYYLGDCIDLDEIASQRVGGIELIQCWNRRRDGFVTKGRRYTPPSTVEVTITDLLSGVRSWLDQVRCPVTLYALRRVCGEAGVANNWARGTILYNSEQVGDTESNVAHHMDDNEQTIGYDFVADPPSVKVWQLQTARQSTTETLAANSVAPCGNLTCDDCGEYTLPCNKVIVGTDGTTGSLGPADVLVTDDSGNAWAEAPTTPFGVSENIVSLVCFEVQPGVNRWLVVRNADGANPLEVAYSDDGGTTWTVLEVGSTNGEEAMGPKALFAYDSEHIWLVTSEGNVFFSSDGGETWTEQASGNTASGGTQLNAIHGSSEKVLFAVGDTDVIIYTYDGGLHWNAATATGTGDDLLSVFVFSKNRIMIGTDGAAAGQSSLWMTFDGGDTYEEKHFTGYASESVVDIDFYTQGVGLIVTNTAGPVGSVHQTINGGQNWIELSVPTNVGLNAVKMCNVNEAFVVGEPQGGTAVIVHITPKEE